MDVKDNLEKMFNLAKEEEAKRDNLPVVKDAATKAEESLDYAQTKLKKYIEIGEGVLAEAESVAASTGEPQAVAAFTNLLKTLGGLSTDVLKSDGEKAKIDKVNKDIDRASAIKSIVNNNTIIFTGSTSELLKKAKKEMEEKIIEGNSTIIEEPLK
jgi:hypothetical protein